MAFWDNESIYPPDDDFFDDDWWPSEPQRTFRDYLSSSDPGVRRVFQGLVDAAMQPEDSDRQMPY